MDYAALAAEWMRHMQSLHKMKSQKNIIESMHGEGVVLQCIAAHGGGVLPGEIGHEMDVSSARIAAALNKLEKKGLVTRQIDPKDRRKILVGITPEGERLTHAHQAAMLAHVAKMLALLEERDAQEYVRITKRLSELMPDCADL